MFVLWGSEQAHQIAGWTHAGSAYQSIFYLRAPILPCDTQNQLSPRLLSKVSLRSSKYETKCLMRDRTVDSVHPSTKREPMQQVTKLLLLAMFAFAARYAPQTSVTQEPASPSTNRLLQAGMEYATDARRLLSRQYTSYKLLNELKQISHRHYIWGQSSVSMPSITTAGSAGIWHRVHGSGLVIHWWVTANCYPGLTLTWPFRYGLSYGNTSTFLNFVCSHASVGHRFGHEQRCRWLEGLPRKRSIRCCREANSKANMVVLLYCRQVRVCSPKNIPATHHRVRLSSVWLGERNCDIMRRCLMVSVRIQGAQLCIGKETLIRQNPIPIWYA